VADDHTLFAAATCYKVASFASSGRRIIRSNEMIEADVTEADEESFASFAVALLHILHEADPTGE
jgi:hypothetical protein